MRGWLLLPVASALLLPGAERVAAHPGHAAAGADDDLGLRPDDAALRRAMDDEMKRALGDLRLGDEPRPYYLAYVITDVRETRLAASFGALGVDTDWRARLLATEVRVGDPSFDNSNFEGGQVRGSVEFLPIEDDYAALRRELWLKTDAAYKQAVETLARKRAAAQGQAASDEDSLPDFSTHAPVTQKADGKTPPGDAETERVRATVVRLSGLFRDYPAITGSRAVAVWSRSRRRLLTSEGTFTDVASTTVRIDVSAETQADDGMRLRHFVPFTAFGPAGLPPPAEMDKAVRHMADELVALRRAPLVDNGTGIVLFEGLAAAQLVRHLAAEHLSGTPPPKTAGDEGRAQASEWAGRLGQRVAAQSLSLVDDPLTVSMGKLPLLGAFKIDEEGVPAQRVSLVENGVLRTLLMSRAPRKEIPLSNGHARAGRFGSPRAHIGNLFVTARGGKSRKALLDVLGKAVRAGGTAAFVVRLLDDGSVPPSDPDDFGALFSFGGRGGPPPVRPLVAYRVKDGKEELVRGLLFEGLQPRSLKDVVAAGDEAVVYNVVGAGGGGGGIPCAIVTPSLVVQDVDVRRHQGKNKRPPLYPHPAFVGK